MATDGQTVAGENGQQKGKKNRKSVEEEELWTTFCKKNSNVVRRSKQHYLHELVRRLFPEREGRGSVREKETRRMGADERQANERAESDAARQRLQDANERTPEEERHGRRRRPATQRARRPYTACEPRDGPPTRAPPPTHTARTKQPSLASRWQTSPDSPALAFCQLQTLTPFSFIVDAFLPREPVVARWSPTLPPSEGGGVGVQTVALFPIALRDVSPE